MVIVAMNVASSRLAVRLVRCPASTAVRTRPCSAPTIAASWTQSSVRLAMVQHYKSKLEDGRKAFPYVRPPSTSVNSPRDSDLHRDRRNARHARLRGDAHDRELQRGAGGPHHARHSLVGEIHHAAL